MMGWDDEESDSESSNQYSGHPYLESSSTSAYATAVSRPQQLYPQAKTPVLLLLIWVLSSAIEISITVCTSCSHAVDSAVTHIRSVASENVFQSFILLITFFRIGALTFGGGYAMIPLIKTELVQEKEWLEEEEFVEVIGITQSVPGAIAVNMAVYLGNKISNGLGAFCAALGVITPSFMVILTIAASFTAFNDNPHAMNLLRGIRPAVVILVFSSAVNLGKSVITGIWKGVFTAAGVIALVLFGVHPIAVVMVGGIAGVFLFGRQESEGASPETEEASE